MLEKLFGLRAHGTTLKTELIAGFTTFLTMAYIIFVNPDILSQAGMDFGAVFVATCLAAAIGCFIMGFYANLPIALAPGMGLNAFFTYSVVLGMGHTWQVALGCVFLSGVAFLLISIFKIREWLINAIPHTLKKAIAAGIGAFLALIALKNAGVIVANPATFVALGDIVSYGPAMMILCFFLIIGFERHRLPGGVMLAILLVSLLGLLTGHSEFHGVVSAPPSVMPTLMQLDILGAFDAAMISVIFAFFFVDLFDTTGTIIGVTEKAGLSKEGKIPNLKQALLADSGATLIGAGLGTSNTTSYIESTSGVAAGGRTGLTAVVVGVLFILCIFFSPLAGMVPAYATAGAIFYVAILMMYTLADIHWDDLSEAAPVAVTFLMMPLTFSIAEGITLGFITFTIAKLVTGRWRELNIAVWVLTIVLLARLVLI
ncbi:NCS2 family permease [Suttonella sp. R2A3]|uniref:NCS2 family permease n=1 Tax=Suttonella sp. R2A3 TaxID=2908648 RepID=UPI001F47B91F|nr:NCS2 family permease [Suttonella sp. R2A3]UJF24836.1 NCS2 family permease [Suttonella sp. R2A3]